MQMDDANFTREYIRIPQKARSSLKVNMYCRAADIAEEKRLVSFYVVSKDNELITAGVYDSVASELILDSARSERIVAMSAVGRLLSRNEQRYGESNRRSFINKLKAREAVDETDDAAYATYLEYKYGDDNVNIRNKISDWYLETQSELWAKNMASRVKALGPDIEQYIRRTAENYASRHPKAAESITKFWNEANFSPSMRKIAISLDMTFKSIEESGSDEFGLTNVYDSDDYWNTVIDDIGKSRIDRFKAKLSAEIKDDVADYERNHEVRIFDSQELAIMRKMSDLLSTVDW